MTDQKTNTAAEMISAAVRGDVAHKFAQAGAAGSFVFGLTLNEFGVAVGIAVAVGGLLMQWYYRRKEYRLKELYYAKHGIKADDE